MQSLVRVSSSQKSSRHEYLNLCFAMIRLVLFDRQRRGWSFSESKHLPEQCHMAVNIELYHNIPIEKKLFGTVFKTVLEQINCWWYIFTKIADVIILLHLIINEHSEKIGKAKFLDHSVIFYYCSRTACIQSGAASEYYATWFCRIYSETFYVKLLHWRI